jgi:uncharacterized membrane protein
MALIGRLHPLLVHFPIVLVLVAVAGESVAIVTGNARWRALAIGNIRGGAVFAVLAAFAGWRFALDPLTDSNALLEWHRWLGVMSAGAAIAAAMASGGVGRSPAVQWAYRLSLFGAGALVAVAGHFGGLLVWGARFLRP